MEKTDIVEEAKEFIKLQIRLNKDNIKQIKTMGYNISELESWDRIYKNIYEILDNVEENYGKNI